MAALLVSLSLLAVLASSPRVIATVSPVSVSIQDFSFNPGTIHVVIGVNNTIVWTNNGAEPHTVTANGGAFSGSSTLSPGENFTHTFSTPGTFGYHCAIHTFMTGTVVVIGTGTTSTSSSVTTTTSTTTTTTTVILPSHSGAGRVDEPPELM